MPRSLFRRSDTSLSVDLVEELSWQYAHGQLDMDEFERQLVPVLQAPGRHHSPMELPDDWYLAQADKLMTPPPVDLGGRLINWAHVVIEVPYRALIQPDWARDRSYMLPRQALLSLGSEQGERVFIASWRNISNQAHTFQYRGSNLTEAIRVINANTNEDRRCRRSWRKPPFITREYFDQEIRTTLGLIPA